MAGVAAVVGAPAEKIALKVVADLACGLESLDEEMVLPRPHWKWHEFANDAVVVVVAAAG